MSSWGRPGVIPDLVADVLMPAIHHSGAWHATWSSAPWPSSSLGCEDDIRRYCQVQWVSSSAGGSVGCGGGLCGAGLACLPCACGPLTVTVLHHTFYGFAILFMGSMCGMLLNPPAVPLKCSSKIMEMGEHPPSRGKPVGPPSPAVNAMFTPLLDG